MTTSQQPEATTGTSAGGLGRWAAGLLAVALAVALVWLTWLRWNEAHARRTTPHTEPPARVRVATLAERVQPETLEVLGNLEAVRRHYLYFKGRGRVSSVKLRPDSLPLMPGDRVSAGELLAQLEDEIEQAQLNSAQARLESASAQLAGAVAELAGAEKLLELASKHYARQQSLAAANATTAEALEASESQRVQREVETSLARARFYTAQAALAEAEAVVGEARQALRNMQITAPISGVVAFQNLRVGDFFAPDKLMTDPKTLQDQCPMVVIDPDSLWVRAQLLPEQAARVTTGTTVTIVADTDRQLLLGRGKVTARQPVRDLRNRMQEAVILLDEHTPQALHGELVRCIFDLGQQTLLLIPAEALVLREGKTYTFVAENHQARLREVQLGAAYPDGLEVLGGVRLGETVVTTGRYRLRAEQSLQVLSDDE